MPETAYRVIDSVPHKWVPNPSGRGGTWQPLPPPPTKEQQQRSTEALKQGLTLTGGVLATSAAAPAIAAMEAPAIVARLLGIGAGGVGGAGGRMLGHALESGDPRAAASTTYGREAKIGGVEGAINEALPMIAGPVTEYGGKFLRGLGRLAFDNPEWRPWTRAKIGSLRGGLGWAVGGPVGSTVAALGPIAATEGGARLEQAGADMSRAGLAERVRGGLGSLLGRIWPEGPDIPGLGGRLGGKLTAADQAERLRAAADAIADEATIGARAPGSPRVNRVQGFDSTGEQPWTPPPSNRPAPRTSTGDLKHVDTRTDFRPDVKVNTAGAAAEPPPSSVNVPQEHWDEYYAGQNARPPDQPPSFREGGTGGSSPKPYPDVTVGDRPFTQASPDEPWWLDQYAIDPRTGESPVSAAHPFAGPDFASEVEAARGGGSVDALKARVLPVDPQAANLSADELADYYARRAGVSAGRGGDIQIDLTGPQVLPPTPEDLVTGRVPVAPELEVPPQSPSAPPSAFPDPAATNLTPDQLVDYYARRGSVDALKTKAAPPLVARPVPNVEGASPEDAAASFNKYFNLKPQAEVDIDIANMNADAKANALKQRAFQAAKKAAAGDPAAATSLDEIAREYRESPTAPSAQPPDEWEDNDANRRIRALFQQMGVKDKPFD